MLDKFLRMFFPMFFSDDKNPPTINEAWKGGKAPKKKKSKNKTTRSKK